MQKNKIVTAILLALLLVTLLIAIASGAVSISLSDMAGSIGHLIKGEASANIHQGVFLQLRLPRVLLCAITGAILAVSGVLMQGLFRNPIVEPGLVGTSAGAAFGASVVYVLSANFSPELKAFAGTWLIPLFAFAGGLIATFIVYALAKNAKKSFDTFFIAYRHCRKCSWLERHRLHELYRQGSTGKKHHVLEPWYFYRCKLDTGRYYCRSCHLYFFHFVSLLKKIKCFIVG